jgi:cation-transporting ATPase E
MGDVATDTEEPADPVGRIRPTTGPSGLSTAEVAERVAAGQTNATTARTSRTVAQIVRANVLTFFNGLLAALFVLVAATGQWQNGLFAGVVLANSAIGVVQELRAKRTLDRLAVLNAPRARVLREDSEHDVPVAAVVLDDLLCLVAGDQVPADGVVRDCAGLTVDESLLTGESEPVVKSTDDRVMSGSIVVAGRGLAQTTAVGDESYAARLATEARRFTATRSELVDATNRLLRWISIMLLVVGPAVLWSQFRTNDNESWQDAVTGTVAALVGMIPEGLVLLTTLAFLVATVNLARRQTLVQELPAVEGLARVDVVCLDKTGTLTHGDVRFDRLVPVLPSGGAGAPGALGLLAAADPANATAAALAAAFASPARPAEDVVPFSSARKWSAVRTHQALTWVLGAPEMVLPAAAAAAQGQARARADDLAAQGRRVLLLARSTALWVVEGEEARLPPDLVPVALVVLAERIREDAAEVLHYFTDQGVSLKVISGDNPRTVGAVAAAVGVPGVTGAADAVDARTLPEDPDALAEALETCSAFGRVTPQQKRAMVAALQRRGHVVAMTGDGVNDALALKDADIGVAMGNGSPATRAVAQLVLLDGRFAHLPEAVAEGRRVIANVERAANLFLVKNVYSLVLALIAVATLGAYPLAPIQLTLVSTLTIGVPGFLLALAPNSRRYLPGFLRRVLLFSVPTGVVTGCAAYAGFAATRRLVPDAGTAEARTTATVVVVVVALWTLAILARPLTARKSALIAALVAAAALFVGFPGPAESILLLRVAPPSLALGAVIGALGAFLVEVAHLVTGARGRSRPEPSRGSSSADQRGRRPINDPAGTARRAPRTRR